jgi:hypothetical protein
VSPNINKMRLVEILILPEVAPIKLKLILFVIVGELLVSGTALDAELIGSELNIVGATLGDDDLASVLAIIRRVDARLRLGIDDSIEVDVTVPISINGEVEVLVTRGPEEFKGLSDESMTNVGRSATGTV